MGTRIVVADGFDKNLFDELCQVAEFDVHSEAKITQEKLQELLPTVEGLVIRSATSIGTDYLEMAPQLKYVIRAGEGTDNIDKVACGQKGVKVSNTPGANNNSAAEHALALMLTVLRHTAWANQGMHAGKWDKSKYMGNELTHKKIGIVGLGRIGKILCKRLAGFEPEVLYYDPFNRENECSYATKEDNLKTLFSTCDIVTIHVPLTDTTKNLINADLLGSMKASAILINAARGGIVDEAALYNLLSQNKIRGAGFDVFASEPLPEDSPLRTLDNLVLTPHLGASTAEAQVRVGQMVIHQLKEYLLNNNLLNEVKA